MPALCPECDGALDVVVAEIEEGQTLVCDDCGASLEVVSIAPLELSALPEAEHDEYYPRAGDGGSDEE